MLNWCGTPSRDSNGTCQRARHNTRFWTQKATRYANEIENDNLDTAISEPNGDSRGWSTCGRPEIQPGLSPKRLKNSIQIQFKFNSNSIQIQFKFNSQLVNSKPRGTSKWPAYRIAVSICSMIQRLIASGAWNSNCFGD